ncbi:unnamed protein product [Paramecium octaurelia]|uniref:Transmembrane protein n=1 Tax=Paramecium octaurelia TaxID=43137 RepID=A0A8S1TDJ7_PAROT|nr:unnamed protein product [Paramecium octaurelia]
MKFIKKSLKYQKLQLQYLIGHSQVALEQENRLFWALCEFIRMFQTIALVLLYQQIIRMLSTDQKFEEPSYTQDKMELISRISMPTILILEYLSLEQIIYFQLIFLALLFLMLLINVIAVRLEYIHFKEIKFQNKKQFCKTDGNSFQSLNLLNSTYNDNDFIEHFLLKQLMITDNGSLIEMYLYRTSLLTNYFTHILFLPQIYWIAIIFYRIFNSSNYQVVLFALNFTLNLIQLLFLIILEALSLYMQQSYRLKDTNYLRLRVTTSFKIGQILRIVPTVLYFSVLYLMDHKTIYDNLLFQSIISCFVLLNLLFDLQDQSQNIPFVQPYKIYVFHFAFSLTFGITFTKLLQFSITDIITLTLMSIPCTCKMLNQLTDYNFKNIVMKTLHAENMPLKQKILKRSSQTITKSMAINDEAHQIERLIWLQKLEQINTVRLTNYKYFLQFVRLYELLDIQKQQVYSPTNVFNANQSKFLMQCIILVKTHIELCNNVYCFCRGFMGEKKQSLEMNHDNKQMKIFSDYTCSNLFVSVDLIDRYIRYYIKLILNIQIYVTQPNLTYITQLISYIGKSEECYQTWLQIMEVKLQLQEQKKPFDGIVINLMTSYSKYLTLQRTQSHLSELQIRKTIQYGDYRSTEHQRTHFFNKLMDSLQMKQNYLIKLSSNKLNYEEVQQLYIEQNKTLDKLQGGLLQFYNQSQCRTSTLLLMFYYLEIRCDYFSFYQYKNSLRSKEIKFFEIPILSHQSQNVSYLKINLSRFSKYKCRGEILSRSDNSYNFFGYQNMDEFCNQIQTVHQLVPPLISKVHNTIMELFLMSSRPNVLRQERHLIAQKANQEIVFIEMFIDVCFTITATQFPVYCFMQELKPIGKFENVRGHIIVDDYEIIQGISSYAYQSLFLDSTQEICNQEISKFYNDFNENIQKLNLMMDSKTVREKRKSQVMNNQQIKRQKNIKSVYNHYKLKLEDQLFVLNSQDKFLIDLTLTLTYGIVNSKISKFYIIEFNKVHQLELTDNSFNDHSIQLQDSIQQSSKKTDTLPNIQDDEKASNESSIRMHQYSFPQINEQCITESQNQIQQLNQAPFQERKRLTLIRAERKSKFFASKGNARISNSDNQINNEYYSNQDQDYHQASATSQKQQSEGSKYLFKGVQYYEFCNSTNEKILYIMHLINALIFAIIITFLLMYQLRYNSESDTMMPTFEILKAFTSTNYVDSIQLSLMSQSPNASKSDQFYLHLNSLLVENSMIFVDQQKNYLLTSQIQDVFKNSDTQELNQMKIDVLYLTLTTLYDQIDFVQNQDLIQIDEVPTFVNLMKEFPIHKTLYEEINLSFQQQVQDSINNFNDSQRSLILALVVLSFFISVVSLIAYYNYFKYLRKITRCSEQVSIDCIDREINFCANILSNKQKINIYDLKMDFSQHQENQTIHSSYRPMNNNNSLQKMKRYLNLKDVFTIKRTLNFLYPLFCLAFILIYLLFSYFDTLDAMQTLIDNIDVYNQSIKYLESFSIMCQSSIIYENRDYLLNKNYLTKQLLQEYYDYIGSSLTYLQESSFRSTQSNDLLKENICSILSVQIDVSICEQVHQGLLQNGILESVQYYQVHYMNNYVSNYSSFIEYSTSEDAIAISFIIKGINNYVDQLKLDLENYIDDNQNRRLDWFIFVISIAIVLQITLWLVQSWNLKQKLRSLKQFVFLLPRTSLYMNDSFLKTLNYVQRHQNDVWQ